MRVLLQRVAQGSVRIEGQTVGQIERGYVLLVGIGPDDDALVVEKMANKVANLRLFPDDEGRFDRSLLDVQGDALVVSQFTLYGDARKGRRPSFVAAADPKVASPLCDRFADRLRELGVSRVETGEFGADMQVSIENDGPVTLMLDSEVLCV